jgi:HSP20 family molecular chaperone IbpA
MAENQELQRDDIRTESARGVTLSPRVDILETDDEMRLVAELPGVKSEDVDIRFENGELTIHGRRDPVAPGLAADPLGIRCDQLLPVVPCQ